MLHNVPGEIDVLSSTCFKAVKPGRQQQTERPTQPGKKNKTKRDLTGAVYTSVWRTIWACVF
jgi:hypothetical protein